MVEKTQVAVVGYGYWGPNLVRNLLEVTDCQVKYICDCEQKQLIKAASRYPSIKTTTNYQEILADKEVKAVFIATPISTHFSLASQAVLAKKHVFAEKPLANSYEKAAKLVQLAEKQQVLLAVGHTFMYSPPVIKTKQIIDSNELGKIYYITSSRVNLGLHQKDASVVWDLAPHDFSILFYWLEEEPLTVSAIGRGCIKSNIPDVAFINLNFPSGVVAQVQLSWLSPVKLRRTVVVGSKKMLVYDDTQAVEKIKIYDHGVNHLEPQTFGEFQLSYRTGDIVSPCLESYEPLQAEVSHFIKSIRQQAKPKTDGFCGLKVVKALEATEKSLKLNGLLIDCLSEEMRIVGQDSLIFANDTNRTVLNGELPVVSS